MGFFARRRAARDHAAALKILKHAAVSPRNHDHTPAGKIRFVDALKLWSDDFIDPPSLLDTIAATPLRRPDEDGTYPGICPQVVEDPVQRSLIEAYLERGQTGPGA